MGHHVDGVDLAEVQRLIDEGVELGLAGLAARREELEANDANRRAAGESVVVTLEMADPVTGDVTRVQAPTQDQAQALLDIHAERITHPGAADVSGA